MRLKAKKYCHPQGSFVSILFTVSFTKMDSKYNGKFSLSTIVFEHMSKFSNKLSSLIAVALKGKFIFPTKSNFIIFTIDIHYSMFTRERACPLLGHSPHLPRIKELGLMLTNTKGLGYQHSMMLNELCSGYSSKFSDSLAGNLGKLWSLSFSSSLLEVFYSELQLCWIL